MEQIPKRSPGRPRAFDRDGAVHAAALLFWRHGYEGTSLTQLTEALGINAPSLYAAFGSKAGLYREALAFYIATYTRSLRQALEDDGPAREAVGHMLQEAARAFSRSECPPGCMVASGTLRSGEANAEAAQETSALRREATQAIKHRLERALKEGELPAGTDPAVLASFFASVVQGLSVQARDGAGARQLARVAETAMTAWPEKPLRR